MDIVEGLKNIGKGIAQVGRGVIKGVVGFIKLLVTSVVLVIIGIYYAVTCVFDFAKKAYTKLKKQRPNVKVNRTGSVTGQLLSRALSQIESEISSQTINLSELEAVEAIRDIDEIRVKLNAPGKATGMQYIAGINEEGEDEVFAAEIFEADAYDDETARRAKEGKGYVQIITN